MKHSYLLSYNSALSKYIKRVDKQLLSKILKTIHDDTPSIPRYTAIWDVNTVLTFISAMRTDNIMLLSQKLATLLMLLSGNRVNMLTHMHITEGHMILTDDECSFRFSNVLKHTRPGVKNDIMTFTVPLKRIYLFVLSTLLSNILSYVVNYVVIQIYLLGQDLHMRQHTMTPLHDGSKIR